MMPRRTVPPPSSPPIFDPRLATFDADTHAYAYNAVPYPSVTQAITAVGFINFDDVPHDRRIEALTRGTYVHRFAHAYLEDDVDLDDCDPRFRGYIDSLIAYVAELKKTPLRNDAGKPIAVEWRFWHTRRRFAGTVDYVGFDADGVLSIDDWKTGSPADVSAAIQTAAYECGVRDVLAPSIGYAGPIRRRAVKLHRDGKPGTPEPYNDPRDLAIFFAALACVHFRRNNCQHGGINV